MKVLIVVTHLLGTGHLSRAVTLARAFMDAGHDVTVISGGEPVPHIKMDGIRLIQLPSVRSDGTNFSRLLDKDGHDVSPVHMAKRQTVMTDYLKDWAPDVLITELFPFGRRNLATEFETLLQTAKGLVRPPPVLSSIRDILAPPSKPAKAERADDLIDTYYNGVLVHADPALIQLSDSWPVSDRLADKLIYTGFVAPTAPECPPQTEGTGDVLVSAGGGSVGQTIFRNAIAAAALTRGLKWRVLVGGSDAAVVMANLGKEVSSENVIIERTRPDFRQLLLSAGASVSMIGYNTAMDLLQTGVPSVVIPFDAGNEVEQTLRATALSRTDGFSVIKNSDLTPERLAQAVMHAITGNRRATTGFAMTGAAQTVDIVENMVGSKW